MKLINHAVIALSFTTSLVASSAALAQDKGTIGISLPNKTEAQLK